MARFSSAELRAEIGRAIDRDAGLSTEAIIREIRAKGLRGANVRLRTLVEFQRKNITPATRGAFLDLNIQTTERAKAVITELGFGEPAGRSKGTHIAITWSATYAAQIFLYGQRLETVSGTERGRIVQPLDRIDRELIEARIENMIDGRIVSQIGSGSESFIEGIEVELTTLDVQVDDAELRGSTKITTKV